LYHQGNSQQRARWLKERETKQKVCRAKQAQKNERKKGPWHLRRAASYTPAVKAVLRQAGSSTTPTRPHHPRRHPLRPCGGCLDARR
jgi:hypothetical protein